MRSLLTLCTVGLLLAAVSACDTETGAASAFDVTFSDTAGREVARVTMMLEPPTAGTTTGTYRVRSGSFGEGATQGDLVATRTDAGVAVSLETGVADGGVMLVGAFGASPFEGTWTAGTIAGPRPGGTYRASPQ